MYSFTNVSSLHEQMYMSMIEVIKPIYLMIQFLYFEQIPMK